MAEVLELLARPGQPRSSSSRVGATVLYKRGSTTRWADKIIALIISSYLKPSSSSFPNKSRDRDYSHKYIYIYICPFIHLFFPLVPGCRADASTELTVEQNPCWKRKAKNRKEKRNRKGKGIKEAKKGCTNITRNKT